MGLKRGVTILRLREAVVETGIIDAVKSPVGVLVRLADPEQDDRGLRVDIPHQKHLLRPLCRVLLVDAYGDYPERCWLQVLLFLIFAIRGAEVSDDGDQVLRYWDIQPVDGESRRLLGVAPRVRQGVITWRRFERYDRKRACDGIIKFAWTDIQEPGFGATDNKKTKKSQHNTNKNQRRTTR